MMAQSDFVPAFEGAEKTLVIDLALTGRISGEGRGLLDVPQQTWEAMLEDCKCQIISSMHNPEVTAFVLSESSLFVMAHKVILKTCGTTQTLQAIPHIQRIAAEMQSDIEFVHYYHTDFIAPVSQPFPHSTFQDEVMFLSRHFPQGKWYSFGPSHGTIGSKWHVFVADYTKPQAPQRPELTFEIHMCGLSRESMQLFSDNLNKDKKELARAADVSSLLPQFKLDECFFEPCGYSMNALDGQKFYATIHITPEPECSYVSFETNASNVDFRALTTAVLQKFQPQNASIVLFADDALVHSTVDLTSGYFGRFKPQQVTTHHFSEGYTLSLLQLQRSFCAPTIPKPMVCSVATALLLDKWLRVQPFFGNARPVFPYSSFNSTECSPLTQTGCAFQVKSAGDIKSALQVIGRGTPLLMVGNCKTKGQLEMANQHCTSITFKTVDDLARIAQYCRDCALLYDVGVLDGPIDAAPAVRAVELGLKLAGMRVTVDEHVSPGSFAHVIAAREQLSASSVTLGSLHVVLSKTATLVPDILNDVRIASTGLLLHVDCADIDSPEGTF